MEVGENLGQDGADGDDRARERIGNTLEAHGEASSTRRCR
jgi:hypothetical protein